MMKKFNEVMDTICPSDEQKDRMFDNAVMMAETDSPKSGSRPKIKTIVAGIIAAAVMAGTTTAFAAEIKLALYSFFNDDSEISEEIIKNIYEDTDGHVVFSVSKIVSDKINTYAIVRYTALDDIGKEWLSNRFTSFDILGKEDDMLNRGLYIEPDNYSNHYVGFSFGLNDEEITDTVEENTRVFKISCNAADVVFNSNCVKIKYVMSTGENRSALINVSESLELRDIKLDSSIAADKPYIPTGVKLSSLGIMIYGENNGLYDYSLENGYSVWSTCDEISVSVKIVTKDGSDVIYKNAMSLGSVIEDGKDYEVQIFTTFFEEPIDPDNIAGIELDGVYFEFKSLK